MTGRTIKDKYRIGEEIGRGGMGIVYRASQLFEGGIEREVAIKSLPAFGDLQREGSAILQLDHPNVIRVFDLVVDDGRYLLVMELIDGATLQKWIDTNFTDTSVLIDAWHQILQGLDAIHKKKVAHLDIKPSNIFVKSDGVLKIGDFGLAATGQQGITRPVGTAKYMAPEVFQSNTAEPDLIRFDSKPDIYSAGFVLYELFLGKTRFNELFAEICSDPRFQDRRWANWHADPITTLQPLHTLRSDISPEMFGIIEKMCAKDPRQRYSDVQSILSDLNHLLGRSNFGVRSEVREEYSGADEKTGKAKPSKDKQLSQKRSGHWRRIYYIGGLSLFLTAAIFALSFAPSDKSVKVMSSSGESGSVKINLAAVGNVAADEKPPAPPVLPKEVSTPAGAMVLIEAGKFFTGENAIAVDLSDFFIDKYEVSNSLYARFVSETGRSLPPNPAAHKDYVKTNPDFPAVNVTWAEASDYCTWAGKHLPLLEEWEKAARYVDSRIWPWGNSEPRGEANLGGTEDGAEFMAAVDSFQKDVSPFGVFGLAGNVAEWTADLAKHRDGTTNLIPVIKGGSYTDRLSQYGSRSPIVARYSPPAARMDGVGFRCAASVAEIQLSLKNSLPR